jgi:DNA repair protein RadC
MDHKITHAPGARPVNKEQCPFCYEFDDQKTSKPLHKNKDILTYLDHFRDKKQEYFICLSLDSGERLISRRIVTVGLLDSTLVHPREVFAGPLVDRAASVIVAHNHPSGDPEPSKQDITTTQQLVAAGILLGVPLHDHFIVTLAGHYSFKQNYLI